MKRRYKLLLIIVAGIILTIFINSTNVISKTRLVALGDGFSLGMTPYKVAGTSFNDYLKEYLENSNNLENYNYEFSIAHQTIYELLNNLEKNTLGKTSRIPIKQTIAKADLITIAIGVDEFADKSLVEDITPDIIDKYLEDMDKLLTEIRKFYDKKIIMIGLYEAYNFKKRDVIEINDKLKRICGKHNVIFFDCLGLSLNKEYYLDDTSYYLNYKAHKLIAKEIYRIYK